MVLEYVSFKNKKEKNKYFLLIDNGSIHIHSQLCWKNMSYPNREHTLNWCLKLKDYT